MIISRPPEAHDCRKTPQDVFCCFHVQILCYMLLAVYAFKSLNDTPYQIHISFHFLSKLQYSMKTLFALHVFIWQDSFYGCCTKVLVNLNYCGTWSNHLFINKLYYIYVYIFTLKRRTQLLVRCLSFIYRNIF